MFVHQAIPTAKGRDLRWHGAGEERLVDYQVGPSPISGNARALIEGIGVVNCAYVNSATDQSWLTYHLLCGLGDGNNNLDQVHEILSNFLQRKYSMWYRNPDQCLVMDLTADAVP